MEPMTVQLPAELQAFVEEKVASGEYASTEAVVQASVKLLQGRERRLAELRREIQIGVDQLDRGEGVPWDVDAILAEVNLADWPSDSK